MLNETEQQAYFKYLEKFNVGDYIVTKRRLVDPGNSTKITLDYVKYKNLEEALNDTGDSIHNDTRILFKWSIKLNSWVQFYDEN